jgi:hypothetical protein
MEVLRRVNLGAVRRTHAKGRRCGMRTWTAAADMGASSRPIFSAS